MERRFHSITKSNIVVRRSDGRRVGEIRDGVLFKRARAEHMLRQPPGWAWDADILAQAERAGVDFTEIADDAGRIWRASLAAFRTHGVVVNRGYGEQLALPLRYWITRKAGEAVVEQLSLFGAQPVEEHRPLPWELPR